MDATIETFRMARFAGADIVAIPSANPERITYGMRFEASGPSAGVAGIRNRRINGRAVCRPGIHWPECAPGAPELSPGGDGILAQTMTSDRGRGVRRIRPVSSLQASGRRTAPIQSFMYRKYLPGL